MSEAEHLRRALAAVEARTPARATQTAPELRSLVERFIAVPDNRGRQETRVIQSTPITAEQSGFALAAQAACQECSASALHRRMLRKEGICHTIVTCTKRTDLAVRSCFATTQDPPQQKKEA